MAFGSIDIVAKEIVRKQPKQQPKQPKRPSPRPEEQLHGMENAAGAVSMRLGVVATGIPEAVDFLCSAYFNISRDLAGSAVSGYTKEFSTISQLTELKHDLESISSKPVGSKIERRLPEGTEALQHCVFSLGPPGRHNATMELEISCGTGIGAGDAVVALVDRSRGSDAVERIKGAVANVSCPVIWVICGFEDKAVYLAQEQDPLLEASVSSRLISELGISGKRGDLLSFAQVYGSLRSSSQAAGGAVVMETWQGCREYTPVGCHVGIFAAAAATLRKQEALTPQMKALLDKLTDTLSDWSSWYQVLGE